jgi:hypothetical protein
VTIGAGGAGSNSGAGSAGGTSSFGAYVSATGGSGGALNGAYANASSGAGTVSSGTAIRVLPSTTSYAERSVVPFVINGNTRSNATSSTAAIAFSATDVYAAGSGGAPETGSTSNDASGGVGGAVIVEY